MKKSPDKYHIHFFVGRAIHQKNYAAWLKEGMIKTDFTNVTIGTDLHKPPYANLDLACTWAHKKRQIYDGQRRINKPYLVMERAYVGERHHWVSLGFNGLNGRANFMNKNITDNSRWEKHFSGIVKPWKEQSTGHVLLIGQVPGDASHRHINIMKWYERIIKELNDKNIPVVFRPHPLDKNGHINKPHQGLKYSLDRHKTLEQSLANQNLRACVTFNSNSGVIAVLNGIPTLSFDEGSMAYDVTGHTIEEIGKTFDREEWTAKLAYAQWLPEELKSGEAWEHLKKGLDLKW